MFRFISVLISLLFIITTAKANDKPTLTVYSYSSFGPAKTLKADFEAQCDCVVNIISIGDGVTILNRLRLEGSRTKADVIIGLDTNLTSTAKQANLVQPHHIAKPQNLAVDWWDNDFVPYDYGYFAFIYDKEKIANPPKSFEQLINNQNGWKIVYQDPRTSTPGLGLLLWMNYVYGTQTPQAWQQLAQHTLTVTKGWGESYGLFLKGEADFVLSYSTSPVYHIINDNEHRYQAAIFDEGHYNQVEVAAITKYTKQYDLANQFMAFLLTPKTQAVFVDKNIMYPAINIELPAAYHEINTVNQSLSFTADDVTNNQKHWIKQWQDIVSQ